MTPSCADFAQNRHIAANQLVNTQMRHTLRLLQLIALPIKSLQDCGTCMLVLSSMDGMGLRSGVIGCIRAKASVLRAHTSNNRGVFMMNRKRGAWVNYNDSPRGSARVARIHPGTISTCVMMSSRHPVLTNGRIGSVSDTVTIEPRTAQVEPEHDQA